jgi:secreted trypsin-like serine protease
MAYQESSKNQTQGDRFQKLWNNLQMNNSIQKVSVKHHEPYLDFTCLTSPSSGACNGDSGGPVILWKNDIPYVFGVTSFGIPGMSII